MNSGTLRLLPRNPDDPSRPVAVVPPPAPAPEPPALASLIEVGLRAYTIEASAASTRMSGHLRPGDRVDVLQSQKPTDPSAGAANPTSPSAPSERDRRGASTIVQGVKILAIDRATEREAARSLDPKEIQSITLLVSLEQAARLDERQSDGSLHLALRNPADREAPPSEEARESARGDTGEGPAAPTILTTRTLRGTSAGSDRLTISRGGPTMPANRRSSSVARGR